MDQLIWVTPLASYFVSSTLAFTAFQTRSSVNRVALLTPVYSPGVVSFNGVNDAVSNLSIRSAMLLFIFIWLLHITALILEMRGSQVEKREFGETSLAVYIMLFNSRRIGQTNVAGQQSKDDKELKDPTGAASPDGHMALNSEARVKGCLERIFWALILLIAYRSHSKLVELGMNEAFRERPYKLGHKRLIFGESLMSQRLRQVCDFSFFSISWRRRT